MARARILFLARFLIAFLLLFGLAVNSSSQSKRHIKVLLETKQFVTSNQETLGGSGSIVIRRGAVNPAGSIVGNDRQTNVQRSSGIFTSALDAAESILTVATRVPLSEITHYYNYALGARYVERQVIFTDVGTALKVNARVLQDGQINLRLTPRISYFSRERPGIIDFTEAATELIVPNGQSVSLGGAAASLHEITRQILGSQSQPRSSEINLVVTATIQNLN